MRSSHACTHVSANLWMPSVMPLVVLWNICCIFLKGVTSLVSGAQGMAGDSDAHSGSGSCPGGVTDGSAGGPCEKCCPRILCTSGLLRKDRFTSGSCDTVFTIANSSFIMGDPIRESSARAMCALACSVSRCNTSSSSSSSSASSKQSSSVRFIAWFLSNTICLASPIATCSSSSERGALKGFSISPIPSTTSHGSSSSNSGQGAGDFCFAACPARGGGGRCAGERTSDVPIAAPVAADTAAATPGPRRMRIIFDVDKLPGKREIVTPAWRAQRFALTRCC
mmetsp:Transcript_43786/g.81878  ORF Transcript_43786/g.81878 Transcript_43786/m.81878 type:complete len:281 (+) Transcript_43786:525-1367(+)